MAPRPSKSCTVARFVLPGGTGSNSAREVRGIKVLTRIRGRRRYAANRMSTSPHAKRQKLMMRSGDTLLSDIWGIYRGTYANEACASLSTPHNDRTTKVFTKAGFIAFKTTTQHMHTYTGTTTSQRTAYTVTGTVTTTIGDYYFAITEVPFGAGRVFYPPMSMEWLEKDNTTLKPEWPTLKNDMLVPTWQSTDGTSSYRSYENIGRGRDYTSLPSPSIRTSIAYPIIGVLAAIILIMVLVPLWRMWRRSEERRVGKECPV